MGPVVRAGPTTTAHWANTQSAQTPMSITFGRHLGDRDALGSHVLAGVDGPARAAASRRRASRRRASPSATPAAPCRRTPGGAAAGRGGGQGVHQRVAPSAAPSAGRAPARATSRWAPRRSCRCGAGDVRRPTPASGRPTGRRRPARRRRAPGAATSPTKASTTTQHQRVADGDEHVPHARRAVVVVLPSAAGWSANPAM